MSGSYFKKTSDQIQSDNPNGENKHSILSYLKQQILVQLICGFVFITSSLFICLLLAFCYILIRPFSHTVYCKVSWYLGYFVWSEVAFFGQWWSRQNCRVIFENPEDLKRLGEDHSILMMNHKYDIDWLSLWILAERLGILGGTKVYGKDSLKWVPIIGWAWFFTESIFLKRDWELDKNTIVRNLQKLCTYPKDYAVTLLLFPEGTRFTEDKHRISMEFAAKKNLKPLKHHLLPRTKGFSLSMQAVSGKMNSLWDFTTMFDEKPGAAPPKLLSVINGLQTHSVIYVRRFDIKNIPCKTEEESSAWLQSCFQQKDAIFEEFAQTGRFSQGVEVHIPRRYCDLIVFFSFAVLLLIPLFVYITYSIFFGAIFSKVLLGVIIISGTGIIKVIIRITETHRGSAYGKDGKKNLTNGSLKKN